MPFLIFEIPHKSSLCHDILGYSAYLGFKKDCKTFIVDRISDKKYKSYQRTITNLKLNYGEYKILYKKNIINIIFKKIGQPLGLSYTTEHHEELFLKIEYKDIKDKFCKEKILQNFLKDAEEYFKITSKKEVICNILDDSYWKTLSKLPKRDINTIDLPKKDIKYILDDINVFYSNEKEYTRLGIPWKRNYLLEGPPGTGKTSLIYAIASHFDLDVYIINLGPKVDDSVYMKVVSKLPKKAILVLEDLDALFVDRKKNDSSKSLVSFSGILNVLDGMARKRGLITFLTTNYKNRLDKALIRPSRIDFILSFKEATEEQIKSMFKRFFPKKDVNKFYDSISHIKLRTCILQQFFMEVKFNKIDLYKISRLKQIIKEMNNSESAPPSMYN